MSPVDTIRTLWLGEMEVLSHRDSALRRILDGRVDIPAYAAILTQLVLQVREHPQALAAFTVGLRGEARDLVRGILSHALSETGHDALALSDFHALRNHPLDIHCLRPLPATCAVLGHLHRTLRDCPALGFVGYLFHHEFLPTQFGESLLKGLLLGGIPISATRFLREHAAVDAGHNRLMVHYLSKLSPGEVDVAEIAYSARVTAQLYDRMLLEAIEHTTSLTSYGEERREARSTEATTVTG